MRLIFVDLTWNLLLWLLLSVYRPDFYLRLPTVPNLTGGLLGFLPSVVSLSTTFASQSLSCYIWFMLYRKSSMVIVFLADDRNRL